MASETAAAPTETVEDLDENVGEARWYKDSPVVLKKVPNKGRGLFARYPLKKGDPLLKSAPYAWATYEPAKQSTCRYCLRDQPNPHAYQCGICKEVWYCSQKCLLLDNFVHVHGGECAMFQQWELDPKAYSPDTIGEMKFLVRVLATKHAEAFPDYLLPPGQLYYSDYCTLVARKEDFDKSVIEALEYWICDYISKMWVYLGFQGDTMDECTDILVRNRRNSFYVASGHAKTPAGCAVFITPSFFNHSCTSNVFYHSYPAPHQARVFEFCADADMPAGTELCITYLDENAIVKNYQQRRAMLRESFLFTCMCDRCVNEEKNSPLTPITSLTDGSNGDATK